MAESKTSKTYLYNAIRMYGIDRKEVVEYITYACDSSPHIAEIILEKITTNSSLKKYTNILKCMITNECTQEEEIDDSTKKEAELLAHIYTFIDLLNAAEDKWVKHLNSMMPERGGNGYNTAPAGGVILHEPLSEERKKYMSEKMKGRYVSEETKQKISAANKGKILSESHKQAVAKFNKQRLDSLFQAPATSSGSGHSGSHHVARP